MVALTAQTSSITNLLVNIILITTLVHKYIQFSTSPLLDGTIFSYILATKCELLFSFQ